MYTDGSDEIEVHDAQKEGEDDEEEEFEDDNEEQQRPRPVTGDQIDRIEAHLSTSLSCKKSIGVLLFTIVRLFSVRNTRSISAASDTSRTNQMNKETKRKRTEEEDEEAKVTCSCCQQPFLIKILKLNQPEKYHLLVGCICAFLFGGVEPAVGWIYSIMYGLLAIPHRDDQSIKTRNFALNILAIYVAGGIAQFFSTITFAKAGEELILRMRLLAFESMLRREMSWFDHEKNSVGSLLTRLSNDTAALKVEHLSSFQ
jgi:hypothetical protein